MDEHLTLESVIDPTLQNSSSIDTADSTATATVTATALRDLPGVADEEDRAVAEEEAGIEHDGSRTKPKRKRKPLPPGSAADFKRREANRLAAERSRSRASEKARALSRAHAALTQEHDELLAAISQIENDEHSGEVGAGGDAEVDPHTADAADAKALLDREQQEQQDVQAQVEAAIAVAQKELEAAAAAAGDHSVGTERDGSSLLDAFISGNISIDGMDGFDPNADDWVQGVENLIKEAESTGRLGELAAVAAVPADPTKKQEDATADTSVPANQANAVATGSEMRADADGDGDIAPTRGIVGNAANEAAGKPKNTELLYVPAEAAAATSDAVAVVLNTEIERILRDDVANTRAAIARVEKQIARIQDHLADSESDTEQGPSRLPEEVMSSDEVVLEQAISVAEASHSALEEGVKELSARIVGAREAKVAEEAVVAKGVEELRRFALKADEEEREKVMEVLKSIRGYLGTLIWGLEDEASPEDTLLDAAFSTPAIARRRRGRPPKANVPLRYNHASLIYPSLRMDSAIALSVTTASGAGAGTKDLGPGSDTPTKPKTKRKRGAAGSNAQADADDPAGSLMSPPAKKAGRAVRGRKSKLAFEVVPDVPLDPALTAVPPPDHLDNGTGGGGGADDDDMIQDIAAKAEDYLLSQLAAAEASAAAAPASTTGGSSSFDIPASARDPAFESEEWTDAVLATLRKNGPGACDVCGRTETTVWRKLVLGGEDYRVCNACGLYHRKFGVIRPPSLWGDGEALKKRRPASALDDGRRNRKARKTQQEEGEELQESGQARLGENGLDHIEADGDGEGGESAGDLERPDGGASTGEVPGTGGATGGNIIEPSGEDAETTGLALGATATSANGQSSDTMNHSIGVTPATASDTTAMSDPSQASARGTGIGIGVGLDGKNRPGTSVPGGPVVPLSTFADTDVDVSGLEAMEEELRDSLGDALFAGLDG